MCAKIHIFVYMQNNGERIEQIIARFFKSKADFARIVGEKPQTISNWVARDNGKIVLDKILECCPQINPLWLYKGEGSMCSDDNQLSNVQDAPNEVAKDGLSDYETWLLPQTAHGGNLTNMPADSVLLQNCERIVSPIKGVDFAISVYGESMSPEYPSGSRVLIKKVRPGAFIEWGKAYVLDTCNGVILKELLKCQREGYVTCHSINPDPKYADFDVSLDDVYGIYRVLMCLSAK